MNELTASPLFGLCISFVCFYAFSLLYQKFKSPLLNPLLLSVVVICFFLLVFRIPVENYELGGSIISVFLLPATACLTISIYEQRKLILQNFLPIILGCFAGALSSVISILLMAKLFKLDELSLASALSKTATTPIAVEITSMLGGIPSITMALVLVTGIIGALASPIFIKLFRLKNPLATGVAIGSSSHSVGTSLAVTLGKTQGAASGTALALTGLMLYFILFVLHNFKA